MRLTELQLCNVRCLADVRIEPSSGINFITGENGSGKTSLIEAIYLLTRARSFRPTSNQRLIREGESQLSVFARLISDQQTEFSLGMQRQAELLRFKHSRQQDAKLIDMVRALPLQLISPDLHGFLERGPAQRRRVLDWGVFHVEPGFFSAWSQYQRALKQRNASLRTRQSAAQVRAWDQQLSEAAQVIDEMRRRHVAALGKMVEKTTGPGEVSKGVLEYYRGWPADAELSTLMAECMEKDRQRGYTGYGPHRADLRLRWQGRQAREVASRGEQKYLIASLLVAQAAHVAGQQEEQPVLLVDDLAAELGAAYREALLQQMADTGMQAFVTVLEAGQIPEGLRFHEMFHVKHGGVSRQPA